VRLVLLLAVAGCAHARPAAPPPKGFARSRDRAAEVCLPPGVKAWLAGLRCTDGSELHTRSVGPVGSRLDPVDPNDPRILLQMDPERPLQPGEPDLHIVEAWEARCSGATYTLFIDMYHCPSREQPPADGFTR
jgi:hypothetical protein